MGISFASVQKMLIAVLVIIILAAFLTRDAFDTAYTAIVLTTLIAVAWGISNTRNNLQTSRIELIRHTECGCFYSSHNNVW